MSEPTPVFVPIDALDEVLAERDRARDLAERLEAEPEPNPTWKANCDD